METNDYAATDWGRTGRCVAVERPAGSKPLRKVNENENKFVTDEVT